MGRGLDNMACAYCSLEGFLNAENIENEQNVRLMVLFDNEEIGSGSLMGAESTFLGEVISGLNPTSDHERICRRKSMILSCVYSLSLIDIIYRIWLMQFIQIMHQLMKVIINRN